MKPCYRQGDYFFLLARVIREGGQFPHPCKAVISPGVCCYVVMKLLVHRARYNRNQCFRNLSGGNGSALRESWNMVQQDIAQQSQG